MDSVIVDTLKEHLNSEENDKVKPTADLAIVELKNGNYQKCQTLSEEIIKIDSKSISGWLLKSFSESEMIDFDNKYFESTFNSIDMLEKVQKYSDIKTLLFIVIIDHYSTIIKNNIDTSQKLYDEAKQKEAEAFTSALIGLAGGAIAGSSKGTLGKVIGGTAAIAGVSGAVSKGKSSSDFLKIAKGVYGLALTGIQITAPIMLSIVENLDHLPQNIRKTAENSIKNWKESAVYLYNKELDTIKDFLDKKRKELIVSEKAFKKFINESAEFLEVKQLVHLGDLIGLDNHESLKICSNLNYLLNKEFSDIKPKNMREYFKTKRILRYVGMFLSFQIFVICGILAENENLSENIIGSSFILLLIGLLIWCYSSKIFKSKIQKQLNVKFKKSLKELSNIPPITTDNIEDELLSA